MKIKYTRNELANIIKSVRAAEGSGDLPIHNWARAAKVLETEAASRLELLRRYEWAGKDNRCPECGGMKPDVEFERKQFTPGLRGHADGCELAEELGDE